MTDLETLREDLAFMKSVATDDGRPHWLIGAHFIAAGLIFGLPLFPAWATLRGLLDWPQGWTSWVSVYSTAVFVPVSIVLSWMGRTTRAFPNAQTSRVFGALWGTIGLTTLVMVFVIFYAGYRLHVPNIWQVWCCVCFALYGSAWLGIAIVTRRKAWALVALGCYLNAVVNALLVGSFDVLLGVATGITLWLAAPGVVLIRSARAQA